MDINKQKEIREREEIRKQELIKKVERSLTSQGLSTEQIERVEALRNSFKDTAADRKDTFKCYYWRFINGRDTGRSYYSRLSLVF